MNTYWTDEDGNLQLTETESGYGVIYGPEWTGDRYEWSAVAYGGTDAHGTADTLEQARNAVEECVYQGHSPLF